MPDAAFPIELISPSPAGIGRFKRPFYLFVALLIAVAVAYGFSQTISQNLISPPVARPWILYVHAAIYFAWVVLFVAQAVLIQARNLRFHRWLGWVGFLLGCSIPVVGIGTALAMGKFNLDHGLRSAEEAAAFLAVPINDMIGFTISFVLAIRWRRKPEHHRRLMLIASSCLTAAAFVRFPFVWNAFPMALKWYAGVDALLLLGVCRDFVVNRRVHSVYLYGVPLLVFGQTIAMTMFLLRIPTWMVIARWLLN